MNKCWDCLRSIWKPLRQYENFLSCREAMFFHSDSDGFFSREGVKRDLLLRKRSLRAKGYWRWWFDWSIRWKMTLWRRHRERPDVHSQIPRRRGQRVRKSHHLGTPTDHRHRPEIWMVLVLNSKNPYEVFGNGPKFLESVWSLWKWSTLIYWYHWQLKISEQKLLTYLTSIVSFFASSTKTAGREDEYLLCDSIDLPYALHVTNDRDFSFSHPQWNRPS